MNTQKQRLATLQGIAQANTCKVSIRKNSYGEYELRLRGRNQVPTFVAASTFESAVVTAQELLDVVARKNAFEERELDREYARDLNVAVNAAQAILNFVGCWIDKDGVTGDIVLHSPKTGRHSLCLKRGVRPVGDLLQHVAGFVRAQTHAPVVTQ